MGKLSSKLSKKKKKENNISVLLYQLYLPRFHENLLKYCRLFLFKENDKDFNHDL